MKCYYEILGVERNASEDDLKRAYRKLALKWHPDKNLNNAESAKENFQLLQQAYEVLTDPYERSWYDNHREAILKGGLGGNYKDDSLNILPYFSATCYKGFGDDPKGFYGVYEEIFNKLAAEESEYLKEDDFEIPSFGKSNSSYEEVVAPFYSHWMSYSTKKTYFWLDPYDTREAPNHKVAKLIEKENKKVRDKAKKERNDEIRNLVAFVRKRDKRVQAWSQLLEEKAKENLKKSEEDRLKQINKRKNQLKDYKESEWLKFSNVENDLKQIEANLAKEFGDTATDEENIKENDVADNKSLNTLFCVACNKVFKTVKAFANHENSKRHKENVQVLKQMVIDKEEAVVLETNKELEKKNIKDVVSNNSEKPKLKKIKKKQRKELSFFSSIENEDLDDSVESILPLLNNKSWNKNMTIDDDSDSEFERKGKKRKKRQVRSFKIANPTINGISDLEDVLHGLSLNEELGKNSENHERLIKNKQIDIKKGKEVINRDLICAVCENHFPSKNKLFSHLKTAGHSIALQNSVGQKEYNVERNKRCNKFKNRNTQAPL